MLKGGLREHFNRNGKPKRPFASKEAAWAFVRKNNLNTRVYECSFCQQYHLATVRKGRNG